jgi:hypothetical protein
VAAAGSAASAPFGSAGETWMAIVISTVEGPDPGPCSGATTFIAAVNDEVEVTWGA